MLNVWGRISSINVRKVVWCAQELGLDFQRTEAGGRFGVVQTPDYLHMNPNGLVPAIDDGEGEDRVTLWESNVIVRYLCARHSMGKLYPEPLAERFDAERWMDWQLTTLSAPSWTIFLGLVLTKPEQRDIAAITAATKRFNELWTIVDKVLATRKFVAGDQLTIGNIPMGIAAYRWFTILVERDHHPHLEAWYGHLTERPAFKKYVMTPLL